MVCVCSFDSTRPHGMKSLVVDVFFFLLNYGSLSCPFDPSWPTSSIIPPLIIMLMLCYLSRGLIHRGQWDVDKHTVYAPMTLLDDVDNDLGL